MILINWEEEHKKAGIPNLPRMTMLGVGEEGGLELVEQMCFTHSKGLHPNKNKGFS